MRGWPAGRWTAVAGAALLALGLTACEGASRAEMSSGAAGADILSGETTTSSPPTTEATTTTAVPEAAEPPPGLGVGSQGAAVLALEQKLAALHYHVGAVDEAFDTDTRDAVMAFQKVAGLDRTGRATDDVVAAVSAASPPPPLVAAGGFKRVEIDLDRQVLFLYEGNNLNLILPVSTGSNERFCSQGYCRRAVTPPGSFVVYQQDSGWEESPLGWLYNSNYFNGGIAIHGSPSVPGYPASHGCVRIPMSAAEWFPDRVSIGTPVYVVSADAPAPAPIGLGATPTSTPTTVVPDTTVPKPATTTTTANFLNSLLSPPTSRP